MIGSETQQGEHAMNYETLAASLRALIKGVPHKIANL